MFWRRLKKISWTDRAKNEEVLHKVEEEKIYSTYRIVHILSRNCLLKHVIERKTEKDEDVSSYWVNLRKRGDSVN